MQPVDNNVTTCFYNKYTAWLPHDYEFDFEYLCLCFETIPIYAIDFD